LETTPDHSAIHKRFLRIGSNPPAITPEEIVIAVDSTGIKVHNGGRVDEREQQGIQRPR
jgi:hypothetical protein